MRDHASDSVVRPDVDDVDESADSGPCLVHGSLSDVVPSVLGSWGSQSETTCPDGESNLDGGVCESFGYRSVSSSVSRLVSTRTVRRPSVLSRPSPEIQQGGWGWGSGDRTRRIPFGVASCRVKFFG